MPLSYTQISTSLEVVCGVGGRTASEVLRRLLIKAKILFLTPEIDPSTFQNMDLDTKILKIGQKLAVLGQFLSLDR